MTSTLGPDFINTCLHEALHQVHGDGFIEWEPDRSLRSFVSLELIATVLAIRHGIVPPTINYTEPDPECDLDYVPNQAREMRVRAAVSNSFAFGGLNAVLVVRGVTL